MHLSVCFAKFEYIYDYSLIDYGWNSMDVAAVNTAGENQLSVELSKGIPTIISKLLLFGDYFFNEL